MDGYRVMFTDQQTGQPREKIVQAESWGEALARAGFPQESESVEIQKLPSQQDAG